MPGKKIAALLVLSWLFAACSNDGYTSDPLFPGTSSSSSGTGPALSLSCTTVAQDGSTSNYAISLVDLGQDSPDGSDSDVALTVSSSGNTVLSESVSKVLLSSGAVPMGTQFSGAGFAMTLLPSASGSTGSSATTSGTVSLTSSGLNVKAPVTCGAPTAAGKG